MWTVNASCIYPSHVPHTHTHFLPPPPHTHIHSQENSQIIANITTGLSKSSLPPEIVEAFRSLWEDAGVRECFRRAYEYQLNDSAP